MTENELIAEQNKLRMYYRVLGRDTYYKDVGSPEEARDIINTLADYLNFAVEHHIMPDHCSIAGLLYWDEEEKEWFDWYDEDGYDFEEHFREMED